MATTSFFPAKPLGCYGDGGAVLTNDAALWERMDSLRVHGKAVASDVDGHALRHDPKYLNVRIGMNSRLDTLQAAILIEKLAIFADEIAARQTGRRPLRRGPGRGLPVGADGDRRRRLDLGAVRRSSTATATAWPRT